MSFEEFKSLNKVVPKSLSEAEAITRTIEAYIRAHPKLKRLIERFYDVEYGKVERNFEVYEDGTIRFKRRGSP